MPKRLNPGAYPNASLIGNFAEVGRKVKVSIPGIPFTVDAIVSSPLTRQRGLTVFVDDSGKARVFGNAPVGVQLERTEEFFMSQPVQKIKPRGHLWAIGLVEAIREGNAVNITQNTYKQRVWVHTSLTPNFAIEVETITLDSPVGYYRGFLNFTDGGLLHTSPLVSVYLSITDGGEFYLDRVITRISNAFFYTSPSNNGVYRQVFDRKTYLVTASGVVEVAGENSPRHEALELNRRILLKPIFPPGQSQVYWNDIEDQIQASPGDYPDEVLYAACGFSGIAPFYIENFATQEFGPKDTTLPFPERLYLTHRYKNLLSLTKADGEATAIETYLNARSIYNRFNVEGEPPLFTESVITKETVQYTGNPTDWQNYTNYDRVVLESEEIRIPAIPFPLNIPLIENPYYAQTGDRYTSRDFYDYALELAINKMAYTFPGDAKALLEQSNETIATNFPLHPCFITIGGGGGDEPWEALLRDGPRRFFISSAVAKPLS